MELPAAIVDFSTPGWGNQFTTQGSWAVQAGVMVVDAYRAIRSKFTDDPGQPKKYKRVI